MNEYIQLDQTIEELYKGLRSSLFNKIIFSLVLLSFIGIFFWIIGITIQEWMLPNWFMAMIFEWDFSEVITVMFVIGMLCINVYNILFDFIINIRIMLLLKKLNAFNIFYKNTLSKIEKIDEILIGTQFIYWIANKLSLLWNYAYSQNSEYLFKYLRLQDSQISHCIQILLNLKSDLTLNINEQQKSLKSAKSEVEENIQWTTELDQVSELQKTRLDKQIEQFEELQRVLVKT